jgi:Skp family chaperone for outer membrane proteins
MMSQTNNLNTWRGVLVAASLVALAGFSMRASSDEKKNTGVFGTVDFKKLSTDYKQKDQVEGTLKKMQAQFLARLSRRDNMPLLTEEEQKQLDSLYEKDNPTDADKAKIKEIEDKAKAASDEIQKLSQKKDTELTDAEKKRLQDTGQKIKDAQAKFATLKEDLSQQFDRFGTAQQDDLMKNIKAAIAKVAEQKGLSIVFSSDVALYAGTDITPQVVTELNKK